MYIFHFYQLLNAAMINHTCKKSPQLILRAFLVFVQSLSVNDKTIKRTKVSSFLLI